VVLPLPDDAQRLHCALAALQSLGGKVANKSSEWTVLDELVSLGADRAVDRVKSGSLPPGLSQRTREAVEACLERPVEGGAVFPSSDPETDTPRDAPALLDASPLLAGRSADTVRLLQCLLDDLSSVPEEGLHLLPCLRVTLAVSAGWSHRDLKQLFSALNYAVMCHEA
jgi:hypothetical protein